MDSLHWTQAAAVQQHTPVILKLNQKELDALLHTTQIKNNTTDHLQAHALSLTPYTQSASNVQKSPLNQLIRATLNDHSADYDALALPLTNPSWRQRWDSLCVDLHPSGTPDADPATSAQDPELWRRNGHFFLNEVNLHHSLEAIKTICFASEWLELDSTTEGIRFDCELALKQELSYATYLSASHLVIPPIRNRRNVIDYARAICSILNGIPSSVVLSIIIPIHDVERSFEAWEDWHVLRKLCGYHPRLNLTLEVSTYRGGVDVSTLISRWSAEPIGFILIPASAFMANAKQFPVLSKASQTFVKSMLKYKPCIILSQTLDGQHASGGPLAYVQYIRHLEKKMLELPSDPIENFASGYLDYLQAPLQPLAYNLDSAVYEGFEKDPVKYSKYEEAIYQALSHRNSNVTQMLAVCGAGRGPLVEAALRASRRSGRNVSIIAIEKNPNSYLTLQHRLRTEWDPQVVQIWLGDMRDFKPSGPLDIIISELLGSFGDNELSPECLDGVIRWLADDGISIPCHYASYVAPLSSTKIYYRVIELGKFETPYVVMIHSAEIISVNHADFDKVQEVWSFDHPRSDLIYSIETGVPITNFHNARSNHLTFHIPQASICHGLAGYFRATLYGSIVIETLPQSKMSREMLSWFPIFFPFKEPIYCPKESELDIHIWRLTDQVGKKVWYEWSAEGFMRSRAVLLKSETESEEKEEGKKGDGVGVEHGTQPMSITPPPSAKEKTSQENTDPALLLNDHMSIENFAALHHTNNNKVGKEDTNNTMLVDDNVVALVSAQKNDIVCQRIRFATSPLHNVLGKESFVKW